MEDKKIDGSFKIERNRAFVRFASPSLRRSLYLLKLNLPLIVKEKEIMGFKLKCFSILPAFILN